jgi:hypothetical protein
MVMLFNLQLKPRKRSVKNKQTFMATPKKLTPDQVRVGYQTEMSHKERQEWLKTRTYSQSKPIRTPLATRY